MNRRQFLRQSLSTFAASQLKAKGSELNCDVLIVGGGVGGFAAALAACRQGRRVVL
ncbi:MAG: FAD-dependent oxidoreductase, partial [Acidobacteriaceae bacterium]|nr:FAD-dependent oxidoreductase [Acidobacteriaceae bacterium]